MNPPNLFSDIPAALSEELFEDILHGGAFTMERIVSRGQATPPDEWCDQERAEWVVLLAGRAGLRLEDRDGILELAPGEDRKSVV